MHELQNRTVMVAGGAGFVGSALVRELLDYGAKVVSYDNYLHGNTENLQGLTGPLTVIQGDVVDSEQLIRVIEHYNVGYIIDCVGDTFVPTSYEVPKRFFDINLQATLALLMAAKTCQIKRVLYVSSTEVYGACNVPKLSEDASINPLNTYAVSKLAADRLCFTLCIEHGIPVVIARIFNCYGPRETHPYIIPEIITQLNKSNVLHLGNITAERDLTYVHDTAKALIAILESHVPDGEVINVGSDTSYSIEWLSHTIANIMGVSNLEIRQDQRRLRRLDIDRFRCDNTKLRYYTYWSPQVKIDEGLRKTVSWFKQHGSQWSWEALYQDTMYYRATDKPFTTEDNIFRGTSLTSMQALETE